MDLFLSYNSDDREAVLTVRKALEARGVTTLSVTTSGDDPTAPLFQAIKKGTDMFIVSAPHYNP